MKKNWVSVLTFLSLVAGGFISNSGCTKETIIKETTLRTDTVIIIKQDIAKLFPKKWTLMHHEIEQYSGGSMTSKNVVNFSGQNLYLDFKSNGSYTSNNINGTNSGTWQLLADNHFVQDINTANERYYYILSISESRLVLRGPFTKTNQPVSNFLITGFYQNP